MPFDKHMSRNTIKAMFKMYKIVQFLKSVRVGTYGTTVVQVWLEVHFDAQSSLYVPVWSVYPGCGHCIEFVVSGCCQ